MWQEQQVISQTEIVFRFRKDIQAEIGWRLISCTLEVPGCRGLVLMGRFEPH